ncbi:hypothetical protein [Sphingobium sp. Z007]|uniref:hypothetical protein n=1 Tax=Sphingobium sp. Z007 TaxID=627495 RepID=UPI001595E050|nr:hypothetical protein [Sphingobium sp. Z007]
MADRVSASIVIGGSLTAFAFEELCDVVSSEGLAIEWDGEPFAAHHYVPGDPLSLFAHEVAGGQFDELEIWCVANALPFVRWCGSYSGQWGPERVVFSGTGAPRSFAVSEDDVAMIDRETIERLGSLEAALAYFEAADFVVPPLVVEGAVLEPDGATDTLSHAEGSAHVE